jgi:hypothetical protein
MKQENNKKITKKELEDFLKELEDSNNSLKPIRLIGGKQFIEECYKALHEYAKEMTIEDWNRATEEYKRICEKIDDEEERSGKDSQ